MKRLKQKARNRVKGGNPAKKTLRFVHCPGCQCRLTIQDFAKHHPRCRLYKGWSKDRVDKHQDNTLLFHTKKQTLRYRQRQVGMVGDPIRIIYHEDVRNDVVFFLPIDTHPMHVAKQHPRSPR